VASELGIGKQDGKPAGGTARKNCWNLGDHVTVQFSQGKSVARDLRAEQEVEWEGAGIPAEVAAAPTAAKPSEKVVITGERLRAWGCLSALSLVDQGLASGAGFAVSLLLARWMEPEVYGAFAVAFAGFLFVSGFHNVLLLEPMSVMGPSRYARKLPAYFRAQIVVHIILVGALSGVLLLGGLVAWRVFPRSPLIGAVMGGGLALPFLLLAWVARRMCYVMQRPALAIQGSAFNLGVIGAGLFALAHFARLNSLTAFALMGCGSLVSAGLLLWRLGLLSHGKDGESGTSWGPVLRENWKYGRWLVGSTVLFSISSQTQIFLVAGFLGLGATGVIRAMQLPSLVMTQVMTAAGLLVLPAFSYDFGKGLTERLRHKAMIVSLGLVGAALAFAAVLALFGVRAEHLLFGGKYAAHAWLMPVLALIPVCAGIGMGYSMALRASQKPYYDLLCNAVAAPVGLLSAIVFMRWWGLAGAAASMVLSFLASGIVNVLSFRRFARGARIVEETA
jgi:O-antigen/teichoic acid export membrane protein